MESPADLADLLAATFLVGDLDTEQLIERGDHLFTRRWRWLRPLAGRIAATFAHDPRPRQYSLAAFILRDAGFARACDRHNLRLKNVVRDAPQMRPAPPSADWSTPAICTAGQLAARLGIRVGELEWFADLRCLESKRRRGSLRHYHYRRLSKRFGSDRMIESPKPRLKEIQRTLLKAVLHRVPAHESAHGFVHGRSIRTFAAPHVGRRVVLRVDLQDFFPSISAAQVVALFRTVGYPEGVARLLTGLCTNATPPSAWQGRSDARFEPRFDDVVRLYRRPHLPQGAPTSPALANLCAYRLDSRMAGLARRAGAVYTRYADDLAFSGDEKFRRVVSRFHIHVCAIVAEEGFRVHHRKTRIMPQAVCQRLAGMVVNQRLNVSRTVFDRLKATLVNCVRYGPDSQNHERRGDFRRHLEGRIAFVAMVNARRAKRLRALFEQISW
ncbi:MAG: reverse transcriptase family protein [Planctomycetota bacterium]